MRSDLAEASATLSKFDDKANKTEKNFSILKTQKNPHRSLTKLSARFSNRSVQPVASIQPPTPLTYNADLSRCG